MNQTEYQKLCATVTNGTAQKILAYAQQHTRFSRPELYILPEFGNHGMNDETEMLLERGLVRSIGKMRTARNTTAEHYELVPMASVEAMREAYLHTKKAPKKKVARTKGAEDKHARELVRANGDALIWIRTRNAIQSLSGMLTKVLPAQSLWDAIPDEDLEAIASHLQRLEEALEEARKALYIRVDDDKRLLDIKQYENTNGRTVPEAEGFRRVAAQAKRNRIVRDY